MSHEGPVSAGSAADWLRHAKGDLTLARIRLPKDGLYSTLCFHAQQAAEKSIKAVLVRRGVEFPKTHSIARLIDLLPPDVIRPESLLASAILTTYATTMRYPAESDDVDLSQKERDQAVLLASDVLAWAEGIVCLREE
jgi:HEPN domain-containing protein